MSLSLEEALSNPEVMQKLKTQPHKFSFPDAPLVRVAVEEWLPHVGMKIEGDGSYSLYGPMALTINALSSSLNFTYELIRPTDGAWGIKNPDGSWSGMVGMVHRKEADLALGPFAMKQDRATVVDYSPGLLIDYTRILILQKPPVADPWGFLIPFSSYMWLGIFLSLFAVTILLVSISGFLTKSSFMQYVHGTYDIFFDLMSVLFQQDLRISSKRLSLRIVFGSWCLFVLIVMKSYSGALTSLLAVRYIPRPINSLRDLIDEPSLKVVLEGGSAISSFIQSSDSGIMGDLNELYGVNRIVEVRSTGLEAALKGQVTSGESALFLEEYSLRGLLSDDFSETGQCQFYMPNDFFLPWILSLIGQKKHPLMDAISSNVQKLTTAGLYTKWLNEMLPNATACAKAPSTVSVSEPYSVNGLWGIFALLIGGLVLSIVLFLLEVVLPKFSSDVDMSAFKLTTSRVH